MFGVDLAEDEKHDKQQARLEIIENTVAEKHVYLVGPVWQKGRKSYVLLNDVGTFEDKPYTVKPGKEKVIEVVDPNAPHVGLALQLFCLRPGWKAYTMQKLPDWSKGQHELFVTPIFDSGKLEFVKVVFKPR